MVEVASKTQHKQVSSSSRDGTQGLHPILGTGVDTLEALSGYCVSRAVSIRIVELLAPGNPVKVCFRHSRLVVTTTQWLP